MFVDHDEHIYGNMSRLKKSRSWRLWGKHHSCNLRMAQGFAALRINQMNLQSFISFTQFHPLGLTCLHTYDTLANISNRQIHLFGAAVEPTSVAAGPAQAHHKGTAVSMSTPTLYRASWGIQRRKFQDQLRQLKTVWLWVRRIFWINPCNWWRKPRVSDVDLIYNLFCPIIQSSANHDGSSVIKTTPDQQLGCIWSTSLLPKDPWSWCTQGRCQFCSGKSINFLLVSL